MERVIMFIVCVVLFACLIRMSVTVNKQAESIKQQEKIISKLKSKYDSLLINNKKERQTELKLIQQGKSEVANIGDKYYTVYLKTDTIIK